MNKRLPSILRTFYVTFIIIILFVIVAGIGLTVFANYRINKKLTENYSTQQLEIAKQTVTTLSSEVESVKSKLLYVAQIEAIRSLDPKVCNTKIDEIIKTFGLDLGNIGRTGPDGKFYCSGNKQLIGVQGSTLGSYVTEIFNDPQHQPVMSRMIYPKGATSYLLAVHVPVFDTKGAFIGTLGGAISVRNLAENYLKDIRIGKAGFVSVVDDNGDIIYSRDANFVGKNRYGDEIQNATGHNAVLNAAFESARTGTSANVAYVANGQPRVAVMTSKEVLPGRRWVVYGIIPQSEISDSAHEIGLSLIFRRLVIGFTLTFLLATIALLRFVRRRVFKPIHVLSDAARKVQGGNLHSRVHLKRMDELGQLGASFNAMLEQINFNNRDLESQVKLKTEQLSDALSQSESKNKSLEDTKKAMLNVMGDLAEEKSKLQTETTRVEAMINSMGDGLVVTDQYAKIVQVNPVAEKLLKTSASKLVGQWYPGIVLLLDKNGKEVPAESRPITQAIITGKAITSRDYSMTTKGHSHSFPVSVTVSPLLENGQPTGVVEIFRDITEERQLDQAKDDFVSLASHQLRTPATAVKQYLGMIKEGYAGKITDEQQELVDTAYESNEREITIVDDLLNVSRLELGKVTINPQPTDLDKMIQSILRGMDIRFKDREQTVTYNQPGPISIPVDEPLIRMTIENLIDNASKYTPNKGKVEVSLTRKNKTVIVQVKDHGVGIAAKDVKHLFRKFSRIENPLSVLRGGTGLGLYVARQIIQLHHGDLTVKSELGKGSTFTIELKES